MAEQREVVAFTKSRASVILDGIRGLAAVLVTFEHLRYRLFFDFETVSRHSMLIRTLFLLSQLGHSAVIVFFVLSGFLVGGSILRAYRGNTWSWSSYLTHRLVRLWIVLIPALLMGWAWDSLSIHVAHSRINPSFVDTRVAQTALYNTFRAFLGNVVFLQGLFVPVFGSNGPLWSLANEFWYYILFPLVFFAACPLYGVVRRILFLCCFLILWLTLGGSVDRYAPIWACGVLLLYMPSIKTSRITRGLTLALYLASIPLLLKLSFLFPLLADYLLGALTGIMVWVVLSARTAATPTSWPTRSCRRLASFSYTLYLVHVPIFTCAGICLVRNQRWQPTARHLGYACAVWFGTMVISYAMAFVTEYQTDRVRCTIEKLASTFYREILRDNV